MQTQGDSPRPCQGTGQEGALKSLWRSRQKQSRCTEDEALVPSKDPTREAPVPECKAKRGEDPKRSVHDLNQPSKCRFQVQSLSWKELSSGRKHPKVLGVLISGKGQQMHEWQIPVNVCCSRLAANHFLDIPGESNALMGTENAGSSQDRGASINTSHEVSCPQFLYSIGAGSAYDKVWVRNRWVLIPKVLKITLSLKLRSTHCICLPKSTLKGPLGTTHKPSCQRTWANILTLIQDRE